MRTALATAGLLLALSQPALAQPAGVHVADAWSRPAAAGGAGAGYMTVMNHGKADALTGAESPVAGKVEMHASSMTGGVMRMAKETRVPLPPGGSVSFAPGGRHLMLIGLKRPLRLGERVPATLRFASGAKVKVEFVVRTAAPAQDAAEHHHH